MRLVTWEECMNRHAWPLVLAGATLVLAGCGGREEREERASESAAQEQHEKAPTQRPLAPVDWKQVDAGLGKSGALQPDGAYKVGMPRSDMHVTTAGVVVKPALALGSWVAFKQVTDSEAMVMGDLVLLEGEVSPVLGKLQDGGIEQTALHNHLLHESPRVMYMHIAGRGTPARLAAALHAALALTTTPLGAPAAAAPPGSFGIDTAQSGQTPGFHGGGDSGGGQGGGPRGGG